MSALLSLIITNVHACWIRFYPHSLFGLKLETFHPTWLLLCCVAIDFLVFLRLGMASPRFHFRVVLFSPYLSVM